MTLIILLLALFLGVNWYVKQALSSTLTKLIFAVIVSPLIFCLLGVASRWWQLETTTMPWLTGFGLCALLFVLVSGLLPTKLRQLIYHHLLNALAYLFTFPFRLLWRMGRLWLTRERIPSHALDPNRPIVGHRPPLVTEKRDSHTEEKA